ncbi:MAG: SIMPL domain-containing protein [Planctomycetaceae bacterium]
MTRKSFNLALALTIAILPAAARAQFDDEIAAAAPGTVSGMGTVIVKEKPTIVRMTIQLQEKAKTVEESLAKLKDRRDAAIKTLQTLGATKDSITATDPTRSVGKTPQEQRMQQIMMQQMRARDRTLKALEMPKSVLTSSTLTVEWPLTMETNEELLKFADMLQDKIIAADLAGLNEPKELTPEEEELQAEMEEAMSDYVDYGDDQSKPGVPTFIYVARISEKEKAKALADAFEKAQAHAQELATAAQAKLGKLSSLNGSANQSSENLYADSNYAYQVMMAQSAASEHDPNEGKTVTPGTVTFRIFVNATFRLE